MTTILLYCTADAATSVIADLITQSKTTTIGSDCWALIRSPSQAQFDGEGTPSPIEPFETGYKNVSIEALIADLQTRVPKYRGLLTPRTFAFVDERSARDQTVVLVHEFESTSEEDLDAGLDEELTDEEAGERLQKEWKQFRVKFVGSWEMMARLEEAEHVFLEAPPTEEDYDENGIYIVKDVVMKTEQ